MVSTIPSYHLVAMSHRCSGQTSTECERECLYAGIEELDLELPVDDRFWLADQLMQPLLNHAPVPGRVYIEAVSLAWRLTVDRDTEPNMVAFTLRTHDEMKVSRVKAVGDPTARTRQN